MNLRAASLVVLASAIALIGRTKAQAGFEVEALAVARDGGQSLIGTDVRAMLPTRRFGPVSKGEQKLVLYRWWTDGCPFCERSLPALEELRTKYQAQGLGTVAVYHPKPARNVSDEAIQEHAEELGYHGPLAADLDWAHLRALWLSTGTRAATSASFLVDHTGCLTFVHPGPEFHNTLESGHEACLAGYEALDAAIRAGLEPPVTLGSLLDEMQDRAAWTRTGVLPLEHETLSWFPRAPRNGGDSHGAMFLHGSGAILRIQSTVPTAQVEVRVDGADEPVIRGRMDELASGRGELPAPLAEMHSGSYALRLPIPFRHQVEIRCRRDESMVPFDAVSAPAPVIEVRRYVAGTRVEGLTRDIFSTNRAGIARAAAALLSPNSTRASETHDFSFTLSKSVPEGLLFTDRGAVRGPRAIAEIHLRVEADDLPRALRRLILNLSFDGEATVSAPLTDFFATDERMSAFESWPITVLGQGDFVCRWIMPYRERFDLAIDNLATSDVHVAGLVRTIPWEFDARTLYFRARWQHSASLFEADAERWWSGPEGPGMLVGEFWSLVNTSNEYWGTGAFGYTTEKLGSSVRQSFQSLFGFQESSPGTHSSPHEARARLDAPDHHGFTSLARFRTLDALPFRSLSLHFERPRTPPSLVDATITHFYYARPGTGIPPTRIGARDVDALPRTTPAWRRVGVIEGEDFVVTQHERVEIGVATIDAADSPASWSNGKGLRARLEGKGAFLQLEATLPSNVLPESSTRATLRLQMSRGPQHANVRFLVNGVALTQTFDGHSLAPQAPAAVSLGSVDLGRKLVLRIESLGVHRLTEGDAGDIGFDFLEFSPLQKGGK